MSTQEKHPHIDNASEEQLTELLAGKPPPMSQLYLEAHRLLLTTLPEMAYATDCKDGMTSYGIRQYGYDGWGMAALGAYKKWVSLMFMRGASLPDPDGLLEGGGKLMRHVKVRSAEQFEERREALRQLINEAAALNDS